MQAVFYFYLYVNLRDLHSFPTRRSSDLVLRSQLDDGVQDFRVLFISCFVTKRDSFVNHADDWRVPRLDRKSTRLNSSHVAISYAVFCLKKKKEVKLCIVTNINSTR